MSSNIFNQVAYLRTSREYPEDLHQLTVEVNKSYLDIAAAVNQRVIGLYATNRPVITGESWFLSGNRRQQTLRQVYQFTSDGSIPHGINVGFIIGFTRIYGTFTDGTSWYPLPSVSTTDVTEQTSVNVDSTNINIDSGATAPTITSGYVVLEWLANP